jgi:hypothetical protein
LLETTAFHDMPNAVQFFAFSGYDGTRVSFQERGMLKQGQTNPRRPLRQGMKGIEMKQVSILARSGDAEDILQRLGVLVSGRQRLNLEAAISFIYSSLVSSFQG